MPALDRLYLQEAPTPTPGHKAVVSWFSPPYNEAQGTTMWGALPTPAVGGLRCSRATLHVTTAVDLQACGDCIRSLLWICIPDSGPPASEMTGKDDKGPEGKRKGKRLPCYSLPRGSSVMGHCPHPRVSQSAPALHPLSSPYPFSSYGPSPRPALCPIP